MRLILLLAAFTSFAICEGLLFKGPSTGLFGRRTPSFGRTRSFGYGYGASASNPSYTVRTQRSLSRGPFASYRSSPSFFPSRSLPSFRTPYVPSSSFRSPFGPSSSRVYGQPRSSYRRSPSRPQVLRLRQRSSRFSPSSLRGRETIVTTPEELPRILRRFQTSRRIVHRLPYRGSDRRGSFRSTRLRQRVSAPSRPSRREQEVIALFAVDNPTRGRRIDSQTLSQRTGVDFLRPALTEDKAVKVQKIAKTKTIKDASQDKTIAKIAHAKDVVKDFAPIVSKGETVITKTVQETVEKHQSTQTTNEETNSLTSGLEAIASGVAKSVAPIADMVKSVAENVVSEVSVPAVDVEAPIAEVAIITEVTAPDAEVVPTITEVAVPEAEFVAKADVAAPDHEVVAVETDVAVPQTEVVVQSDLAATEAEVVAKADVATSEAKASEVATSAVTTNISVQDVDTVKITAEASSKAVATSSADTVINTDRAVVKDTRQNVGTQAEQVIYVGKDTPIVHKESVAVPTVEKTVETVAKSTDTKSPMKH